ncbi:MAG: phytanoyl-CoA dioxygenase family protein [Phycisphaerales bacterium]|nr:phytanoyl-CoA dioxygenase family protein [Phycisphaerales bacterium]
MHTQPADEDHGWNNFTRDGFVVSRGLLASSKVAALAEEAARVAIRYSAAGPPHAEYHRPLTDTLQVRNSWQLSDPLRRIVCSRSLAQSAAALLGVAGVQLYADLIVLKEPGAAAAPWHIDAAHAVVDGESLLVAYLPLHAAGPTRAGLAFRAGSHRQPFTREFRPTSQTNYRRILRRLNAADCPTVELSFLPGDVAFYSGLTFHRLAENRSAFPVASLWVMYLPAGQTMTRPSNAFQAIEKRRHFPQVQVGKQLTTPLNPLLYHSPSGAARRI